MKKLAALLAVAVFAAVIGWIVSSVVRMPDYPYDWSER